MNRIEKRLIRGTVRKAIPLSCLFELTYQCNLRCIHCYVVPQERQELSTDEIRGILEQLAEEGCFILSFSGGEVFLRPDFFEIAKYARKLKFALKLFTNATLIDEDNIDRIKELCFSEIHITIFSDDPETHDSITRVTGSFQRSIAAIKLLRKEGIRIKLKCPLMKQNVNDYQGIIKLAEDLGASYRFDPTISARNNGSKDTFSLRITDEDLFRLYSDPLFDPYLKEDSDPSVPYNPQNDILTDRPCSAGHNFFVISPYGDVFPCNHFLIKTGNLREKLFKDIWYNSPEMLHIRSVRTKDLTICSECPLFRLCCIRCPGLAYLEDGDFRGPSTASCRIAKMLIKVYNQRGGGWQNARREGFEMQE